MRTVDSEPQRPAWWWGEDLAVDPWQPCRLYMTENNASGGTSDYPYRVLRGDVGSGGSTAWSSVFVMPAEPEDEVNSGVLSPNVYTPSAPVVSRPDLVWFGATSPTPLSLGAQPRAFRSGDAGWHWTESDQGLIVQSRAPGATRLIAAPSDPQTLYFLSDTSSADVLSVSRDGGRTWRSAPTIPANTSGGGYDQLGPYAVDPLDAGSLYHVAQEPNGNGTLDLSATHDAGSTWSIQQGSVPGDGAAVDQFFVTRRTGADPAFYLHLYGVKPRSLPDQLTGGPAPAKSGGWYRSLDSGVSWQALPLPRDSAGACPTGETGGPAHCNAYAHRGSLLAADPSNPSILVWINGAGGTSADTALDALATTDAFGGAPLVGLRLSGPSGTFPTAESLQGDARGDFFLAADFATKSAVASAVVAFRPTAFASGGGSTVAAIDVPAPPPSSTGTYPMAFPAATTVQSQSLCPIPTVLGGSLAFDGRYLVYAQGNGAPGVIYRLDAATCQVAAPLVLTASDFASGSLPSLTALTYDSLYRWPTGEQGAILAAAFPGTEPALPDVRAPIYAINPVTAAARLLTSVDVHSNGCSSVLARDAWWAPDHSPADTRTCPVVTVFSFDIFRNGIWTVGKRPADPSLSGPAPGFLSLATGAFTPNRCGYTWDSTGGMVVAGPHSVYVQAEDDQILYQQDMDTCAVARSVYAHMNIGENPYEDEQIACDAISSSATPLIWERNAASNNIQSYPIPDPYCPFLTRLTYQGPTLVQPGTNADLCFTLEGALAGRWQRLGAQPITVKLSGTTAGRPFTDAQGRACLATAAPVAPATLVQGTFAGTSGYLPASAEGTLLGLVVGGGALTGGLLEAGGGPPLLQPTTTVSTITGSQAAANASTQVEAQMQAQAQSQAQTQSVAQVQPGVMVQREKRVQIAVQEQSSAANVAYQAKALPRSRPAPVTAVAAGLMLLGFGLLARRPRWALSRKHRRE